MAALLCTLCAVSGVLSAALVTLPDVKLGDSITLPCKHLEDSPVEQKDVRWLLGVQPVIRLDRDQIIYSISYRNRTELPAGGAGHDFSLTITRTQPGDSGVYRCVIFREEQEELTLSELQLTVEAPPYRSAVVVRAGDDVVLPCFGRVDWLDSEAEFVQWKRGWTVLEWVQGSLYVAPQFEGRVSLQRERLLQDNVSLELKDVHHEDQGAYLCFFRKNKNTRLAAQMYLTVTDHITRLKVGIGSSALLPLHTASPVTVRFRSDGGNGSVVCEVEKDQMKRGAALQTHRMALNNHTLELRNISMEVSGMFSVIMKETQHTVSVVLIQVFPPPTPAPTSIPAGSSAVQTDELMLVMILAPVIVLVVISIFALKTVLKGRRLRGPTDLQEAEVHPLTHPDVTSSKISTEDEQPVSRII